jgi:hypothetical protein
LDMPPCASSNSLIQIAQMTAGVSRPAVFLFN